MILKLYLPFLISEKDNYMTIIIPVFIVALNYVFCQKYSEFKYKKRQIEKDTCFKADFIYISLFFTLPYIFCYNGDYSNDFTMSN